MSWLLIFFFLLSRSAGPEVGDVNCGQVFTRAAGEPAYEISFQPPLKGPQEEIDQEDSRDAQNKFGKGHT